MMYFANCIDSSIHRQKHKESMSLCVNDLDIDSGLDL